MAVMRTHTCGELTPKHEGKEVTLVGWVNKWRDHGGVLFLDLGDRYGITQVVLPPDNKALQESGRNLRAEWVLRVRGEVRRRPEGMANPSMPTGEIEVVATDLEVLNPSKSPPFVIQDEVKATEESRLKYRFLDLRRAPMKEAIVVRHRVSQTIRTYLDQRGFLEVETPILTRSTPEGARDYLVPSRVHPGKFYCLAQSPQLYKQLLMVAGFDRYYQFARCFRDEDQRKDRQPEHTQIDIELSFVDEEEIFSLVEGMLTEVFRETRGVELETPFRRLTHSEAMARYGTDKPDLRFGLQLQDLTQLSGQSDYSILKKAQVVKGVLVPADLSRKEVDSLEEHIRQTYGAPGLVWMKFKNGEVSGPPVKFFSKEALQGLKEELKVAEPATLLIVGGEPKAVSTSLGWVRGEVTRKLNLLPEDEFKFCWITEFPLFEWSEEEERWVASHHIFSMPMEEDLPLLDKEPGKVRARLYDLVCNGLELASGSIRNHRRDVQERVMEVLGISKEEAESRFGFLLNALEYGAPPHGGIAPGLDRIVALVAGFEAISDVIPFPKTLTATALLEGAPSEVTKEQLEELHIRLDLKGKKES